MPLAAMAALVVFLTLCVLVDVRARRIPNALTGAGVVVGLGLNGFYFGLDGVTASLVGIFLMVAVLLLPFALGGIGGGDVKMMAAVGALAGPRLALSSLVVGMILGGVIMAGHLARQGRLGEKVRRLGRMLSAAALTASAAPLRVSADDQGAIALPYSLPLGLGTVTVLAASGTWRVWP